MKCALITTTINIPHVLKLYRACGPDVGFFVAGDEKTPHEGVERLADQTGGYFRYLAPDQQTQWGCSDFIGWNTISRRNIALLEALKWGAEIIVTCDDDNAPLSTDYFDRFEMVLGSTFSGLKYVGDHQARTVGDSMRWFDPGLLLGPPSRHRGFPIEFTNSGKIGHAVDAEVGVAAGMCLGDPDIGAVDRISVPRQVHQVSEILRTGVVVDPSTKTVFNSQNTAFIRELAPCFLMCPQFGRYDDIFASLIAQRVMREKNLRVHFGQPFVWQQRNPHDLTKDLKAELWGMEHVVEFAEWLDRLDLKDEDEVSVVWGTKNSVLTQMKFIYWHMGNIPWMPPGVSELGLAWCEDVEKVL